MPFFMLLIVGVVSINNSIMLHSTTLNEISNNINTGVEYEIALFYQLLVWINSGEQGSVLAAINLRSDAAKIKRIVSHTNIASIDTMLRNRNLSIEDVSFETQNDTVGPSDIVMHVADINGNKSQIGLSVKYANSCSLNVTGRNFITDAQIKHLKALLPKYTQKYINEMEQNYGNVQNWFRQRKPSVTTDEYIDLIRDAVIANWSNVSNKATLLSALFHINSPIEFWVVTYSNNGFALRTKPQTVDINRANEVNVAKYMTSYVGFYLDKVLVGRMQVKFNNGFLEKCKKTHPDITHQGVNMSYGQPFSSWNFSVEK